MSSVGLTAHYTAYTWHLLGVPEAHRFATGKGQLLHFVARPVLRLAPWLGLGDPLSFLLESRHLLLEHLLREDGCRTFVEIASGLSPRGTAYSVDPDVVFVEVDLPAMSALKTQLVGNARGPGQQFLAGDAMDPGLYDRLLERVRGRGPVTVVAEGLNSYLTRESLERMVLNVSSFLKACGGGRFVLDINPADALPRFGWLGAVVVRAIETVARYPVSLPVRSAEDAVQLLRRAGFSEACVHDPRAHPATAGHDFSGTRGVVLVLEGRIR
ncbi:MAG: class I SAM-dependent methyltransferase [bacterium]